MKIGVPKEIKSQENRVAITPAGAHQLASKHQVFIEKGAGANSGIADEEYVAAGATMVDVDDVWTEADLIFKVKEPVEAEYHYLRQTQAIFTYLHLAADKPLTDALLARKVTGIAYETVQLDNGALPLLRPMSEVAGRMSVMVGANTLLKHNGGSGKLIGSVPGVPCGRVVVVGAGVAGSNAAQMAFGLRADVTVLDVNLARLVELEAEFDGHIKTVYSTAYSVAEAVADADLIIGSVLIPGAAAPKLVTHEMMMNAKPGSVWVDIAVDQGGCFEDTHPTTHANPTYNVGPAVVYAVANMPGAVPFTSTYALTNATLAYATQLADKGWRRAMSDNPALAKGLNTFDGNVTNEPVAQALGYTVLPLETVLSA